MAVISLRKLAEVLYLNNEVLDVWRRLKRDPLPAVEMNHAIARIIGDDPRPHTDIQLRQALVFLKPSDENKLDREHRQRILDEMQARGMSISIRIGAPCLIIDENAVGPWLRRNFPQYLERWRSHRRRPMRH